MRRLSLCFVWLGILFLTYPAMAEDRYVRYVIDGDTVVMENGEKVRLIGIDAPETHDEWRNFKNARRRHLSPERVDEYAFRSRAYLKNLTKNEPIRLEYGEEARDRYGRTLAYLYRARDGVFLNELLVSEGYAFGYFRFPYKYKGEFMRDEEKARRDRKGLWA